MKHINTLTPLIFVDLTQLPEPLVKWLKNRRISSESELHSLIGKLLHVCEVVRPGIFFVGRTLNQLGLPLVQAWHDRFRFSRGGGLRSSTGRSRVHLGRKLRDDLSFWRSTLDRAMGPGGAGTLDAPRLNFIGSPTRKSSMPMHIGSPTRKRSIPMHLGTREGCTRYHAWP